MIRLNGFAKTHTLSLRTLTARVTNDQFNSSDTFGDLSESGSRDIEIKKLEKHLPKDPDGYDQEEFSLAPRKNLFYYEVAINNAAKEGPLGLRQALELFENMKKERLTPEYSTIAPIIIACARAGYTRKAFEVYQQLLRTQLTPSNSILTSLINACAECPFKEYGLNRLKWVRDHLKFGLNKEMNLIMYNCAVKAYGKLGRLDLAGELVSEMIRIGVKPDNGTFNMLLMGCISDKQAGTILALRIFKKMKQFGFQPDINSYNLLLRCVRECGLGSQELVMRTIGELPVMLSVSQKLKYKMLRDNDKTNHFEWVQPISQLATEIIDTIKTEPISDKDPAQIDSYKPDSATILPMNSDRSTRLSIRQDIGQAEMINLLSDDHIRLSHTIKGIDFEQFKKPQKRILLFGGFNGFFDKMRQSGCPPDLRTFNLMLDCVNNFWSATEIFRLAKDSKVQLDAVFYNNLILKVGECAPRWSKMEKALVYLEEMQKDGFRPSICTFECLAPSCETSVDATELIRDLESCGFAVSAALIHRLFWTAANKRDLEYLIKLAMLGKKRQYNPPARLIDKLEDIRLEIYNELVAQEKLQIEGMLLQRLKKKQSDFDRFSRHLKEWLRSVEVTNEEHPWVQFEVDDRSKRDGFMNFVHRFKALEEAKQEAIASGARDFGNLAKKSEKIYKRNKQLMESQRLASPLSLECCGDLKEHNDSDLTEMSNENHPHYSN